MRLKINIIWWDGALFTLCSYAANPNILHQTREGLRVQSHVWMYRYTCSAAVAATHSCIAVQSLSSLLTRTIVWFLCHWPDSSEQRVFGMHYNAYLGSTSSADKNRRTVPQNSTKCRWIVSRAFNWFLGSPVQPNVWFVGHFTTALDDEGCGCGMLNKGKICLQWRTPTHIQCIICISGECNFIDDFFFFFFSIISSSLLPAQTRTVRTWTTTKPTIEHALRLAFHFGLVAVDTTTFLRIYRFTLSLPISVGTEYNNNNNNNNWEL